MQSRFLEVVRYYRFYPTPARFADFSQWSKERRTEYLQKAETADSLVEIIAFCLMPNHYHFILKQLYDRGISRFVGLIENSFAKYFNTLYKRNGSLFEGRFKCVLVEDDNQLMHLSRYIHLNLYSSSLVDSVEQLVENRLCSLGEYLGKRQGFTTPKLVTDLFAGSEEYYSFVRDQAGYQRSLEFLKDRFI